MADIFSVIADPTRRLLLGTLLTAYAADATGGELSVGQIVTRLGISQPTVSKHLRVLRDTGLVTAREEGQHRYYRLDPEPLVAVQDWIVPFTGAVDADGTAASTGWSSDGVPSPLRRSAGIARGPIEVGTELGRAMAEASFRATSALTGAQNGWGRVVQPVRRRLTRQGDGDTGTTP